YFMDTSSAAAECVTLMAAAGYPLHVFPTGKGNVVGNPIIPVVKLTGNPRTARLMSEHIDVDVSGVLRREITIEQAGDLLLASVIATANGVAICCKQYISTNSYLPSRLNETVHRDVGVVANDDVTVLAAN
ncbi:UxaA family hydrolase, partial [bacterium]|nr:UxaA family hydrolase [bacterium]